MTSEKVYEVAYQPEGYWVGVTVPTRGMADAVVAWLVANVHGGERLPLVIREVTVRGLLSETEALGKAAMTTWTEYHEEFGPYGDFHLRSECAEQGCETDDAEIGGEA